MSNQISIEYVSDPSKIVEYLQIGINIPVLPKFHKFIIHDLNIFKAKSILIRVGGNVIGHALIYNDNPDILYFGFVGIINHIETYIDSIATEIIKYGQENNFKTIRGPINIPTAIYGWGFLEEGSDQTLYATRPVNPPVYQNIFISKGFVEKLKEYTWTISQLNQLDSKELEKYDYIDYQFIHPSNKDEFYQYKLDFLMLHAKNLPESSQITPNIPAVIENYLEYGLTFGTFEMIFFVKYKAENKIVACGYYLPNPFRKDKSGNYDSCVLQSWVVDPKHRRKGLVKLMYNETVRLLRNIGITYGEGPIGSDNIINANLVEKLNGHVTRSHIILEYNLKK